MTNVGGKCDPIPESTDKVLTGAKMSIVLTIQILVYMAIVAFGCGVWGYRSGYRDGYGNGKRAGHFQSYKKEVK